MVRSSGRYEYGRHRKQDRYIVLRHSFLPPIDKISFYPPTSITRNHLFVARQTERFIQYPRNLPLHVIYLAQAIRYEKRRLRRRG